MAEGSDLPRARFPKDGAVAASLDTDEKQQEAVGTITGTKRGIQMFLSGADPADFVNGRAVRKTAAADERVIELDGENVTVFKGSHAAEDELLA